MTDGPVSIGYLLVEQIVQLVLFLPIALVTLWLLRTRWLVHLPPASTRNSTGLRQVGIGTVTAVGALCVSILPALVAGSYSPHSPGWQPFHYEVIRDAFANVGGVALLFGVQSLFEEALFRGIGVALFAMLLMWIAELVWIEPEQRRFATSNKTPSSSQSAAWRQRAWLGSGLISSLLLAVGFGLVHSVNPNVSPIALINIMFAGIWLGLLFWRRISLLAAWFAHYAWNLGLALLGLPISGFALYKEPLGFGISGAHPDLLSGGAFGPEASLPAAVAFAALSAWLCWRLIYEHATAPAAPMPTSADSDMPAAQAG